MSGLVVTPCLPVGRAELAEARRAMAGQGRSGIDDGALTRGLWVARALPSILDVLADVSLLDVEFIGVDVEVGPPPPPRTPLSVLAWRRDEEQMVEVLILADTDLDARAFEATLVRIMVPIRRRIPLVEADHDEDITAEDNVVRLQRFSFGARGKSPS